MKLFGYLALFLFPIASLAQPDSSWPPPSWTAALKPFPIHGPVYYVGSKELSAYLLVDDAGLILVNVGMEENVPMVLASIRELGFDPANLKHLLITQAHMDHGGGAAKIRQQTGARVWVGTKDVVLMVNGGKGDYVFGDGLVFPALADVEPMADGDRLVLGKLQLTALATPGHTPGSTSWLLQVEEKKGTTRHYLLQGSISLLDNAKLFHNPLYPEVADDFRASMKMLSEVKAEFFLPDHLSFARPPETDIAATPQASWFTDRSILARQIERTQKALERMIEAQRTDR